MGASGATVLAALKIGGVSPSSAWFAQRRGKSLPSVVTRMIGGSDVRRGPKASSSRNFGHYCRSRRLWGYHAAFDRGTFASRSIVFRMPVAAGQECWKG